MNRRFASAVAAMVALLALAPLSARAQLQLPRISPNATVSQTLGITPITVTYSRPGVKGRTIWGELVPYDKAWRTGANSATNLTVTDDVMFGGQKLAAGTYALYTIPGKDSWTVVLNSDKALVVPFTMKPETDVVKVKATPASAPMQEWLEFSFQNLTNNSCDLVLRWEKLQVAVPITMDVNAKVLADARTAVDKAKPDWSTPYQAANYAFTNSVGLDDGAKWLAQSIAVQPNYTNQRLLARWQMKDGKKTDAIATAKKAIAAGKASKDKVDTSEMEKELAEWTGTAKPAAKKS